MDEADGSLLAGLNRILSSEHSVKVLEELSQGLTVNDEILKKLGIERRTLYYILKNFRENGLIVKKGNRYMLSILGYFVYSVENELIKWLRNKKDIERINEYINSSETFKITNALLKSLEKIIGVSSLEPVRVHVEYVTLVESLIEAINSSREYVKLISRYIDINVLKALLEAAKRGVTIWLVTNKAYSSVRAKYYLALFTNMEIKHVARELFTLKNVMVRTAVVPYSFAVVDEDQVGIEIPDVFGEKDFVLGIQFRSPSIAEKMAAIADKIYQNAEQDKIIYSLLNEAEAHDKP